MAMFNNRAALVVSKAARKKLVPFLPVGKRRRLDMARRLRGIEDRVRLDMSDAAIVSYEKSGRTWLRVMLSRYYQLQYGLPSDRLLNFDKLHRLDPNVPIVFFTHDRGCGRNAIHWDKKSSFDPIPYILLVRDPRDVAVSYYFQWLYRMSDTEKWVNDLPQGELGIFDFMMRDDVGLLAVIRFMNRWYENLSRMPNLTLFRYEDLRADAVAELAKILRLLGGEPDMKRVDEVVEYAEFEKMKKREQAGEVKDSRLAAGDPENPDSFKARRAKIGGYRDYFSEEEVRQIDKMVADTLNSGYGY